jgi:hypothetical protein
MVNATLVFHYELLVVARGSNAQVAVTHFKAVLVLERRLRDKLLGVGQMGVAHLLVCGQFCFVILHHQLSIPVLAVIASLGGRGLLVLGLYVFIELLRQLLIDLRDLRCLEVDKGVLGLSGVAIPSWFRLGNIAALSCLFVNCPGYLVYEVIFIHQLVVPPDEAPLEWI